MIKRDRAFFRSTSESRLIRDGEWMRIFLMTTLLGITLISKVYAGTMIKIDASSTVYPITEAVAEEFQKMDKGKPRVTVGISGTGGGFKKFCNNETDIS